MKKLQKVVTALSAVAVIGMQAIPAQAQDDQVRANPAEFFACNLQKGKSMKDVNKVAEAFSAWSNENNGSYTAWTLTPQFYSQEFTFDFGWLGAWPDANAFGKGQDAWLAGNSKLAAEFAKVMDCSASHEMASVVPINAPDAPPGDGVVMFSQCSVNDGKTVADSYAVHKKMGDSAKAAGSKTSSYLFYPGMGSGNVDFDYWLVLAFENYTQLGAMMENYINGGGYMKAQETLGPVTSCGSPIVFDAHQVTLASGS